MHPLSAGWTTFALLAIVDLAYLSLDISHNLLFGPPRASFEVHRDHSLPEFFQYMKLGWTLLLVIIAAWATASRRLLLWVPLVATLLATDALTVHEKFGGLLATWLNLPQIAGLRPRDLGELMVGGSIAGLTVLGLVLLWRSSSLWQRSFHRRLAGLVLLLGTFGQGVDMVTVMSQGRWQAWMSRIEDGGEMLVVSAICAHLVAVVIGRCRRR